MLRSATRLGCAAPSLLSFARFYASVGSRIDDPTVHLQRARSWDEGVKSEFATTSLPEIFKQLQQAARDSLVEGLPTVRSPTGVCEPCQLGKQHRVAFPKQASTRASAPLALVHTDLCGPMSTSSLSGLCYMLVLVDDFSRYTWVSFLKLKSEAFGSIRDWKAMVEKEKDLKVKSIRSDRGGEFLSENFARWCKSEGIRRQLTTPYTPSQNGVVERKNRTIMEMARAMLAHASLPRSYWAEACNTAVYIQNRSPTHALQDMTPFQAYYGCKPTVSHFRVFGCSAFVHIPKEKRQKVDFKSRKLLFLGYSTESDAYRLYDPDTRTTTVSRDVVFDESFITSAEGAAAQPIPILPPPSLPDPPASPVITPSTSHPVPPIQPPDVSPDHALSDSDSDLDVADATPEVDAAPPRREKRIPGWLYSTVASSGVTEVQDIKRIWNLRWDWFHRPIHAVAHILHPLWRKEAQYVNEELHDGWTEYIQKIVGDDVQLMKKLEDELLLYRNGSQWFGSPTASLRETQLEPVSWWEKYGIAAPNLRRIALRVLSQDCSSGPCERNWSTWALFHTKKRNKLSTQQLERLVFCHCNLKLLEQKSCPIEPRQVNPDKIDINKCKEIPDIPQEEQDIYAMLYEETLASAHNTRSQRRASTHTRTPTATNEDDEDFQDSDPASEEDDDEVLEDVVVEEVLADEEDILDDDEEA
ncbi:hypothetical protein L7F22_035695 [Adiantum nelumboides]|nr:hypothetical protein [Adiantum nelumboides]